MRNILLHLATLLAFCCSSALGISCAGPGSDRLKWAELVVAESTFVFLARITDPSQLRLVEVEVKRHLKGAAPLRTVNASMGNFRPRRGEERVFFVDGQGVILPCTDYKYFSSNEDIVRSIRSALRRRAT